MNILYEEIIHYTNSPGFTLFGTIFSTILAILSLISFITSWGEDEIAWMFVTFIFCTGVAIGTCTNYVKEIHHPEGKQTNYWVTLDDSYSVNHLHDEYEIVDIKGDIYVITEKEEG